MENTVMDAATTHQMYCVRCRTMVTIVDPKRVVMKSQRHALHGRCPHCEAATYKIISKE